jgi:hypothetical protein
VTTLTEEEWQGLQATLVRGGLREYVEGLVAKRLEADCVPISDANRAILYRAYDDGNGGNITLATSDVEGYFVGLWEDVEIMEGTEVDGVLYSVCPQSGGGLVTVLVGEQITDNDLGPMFHSNAEARAYILGLTEQGQNAK